MPRIFANMIAIAASCLLVLMSSASFAATSDTVLAARAAKLYKATDQGPKGERYFRISVILDTILDAHPKTLTALRIKKNKFPGINLEEIRKTAEKWERAFPEKAAQIRNDRTFIEPSESQFDPPKTVVQTPPPPTTTGSHPVPVIANAPNPQPASPSPVATAKAATTPSTPTKFRRGQRIEILNGATVLVIRLVKRNGKLQVGGHGTGFFINESQILTNTHVARGADAFVIASKILGIGQGTVVAYGQTKSGLGIDAAVLDVKGIRPTNPLIFSIDLLQGDTISIAGYPGVIGSTEQNMGKLFAFINDHVKPSPNIVPSLRITDTGVIEAIFDRGGVDDIQYTMETTGGNSGSPVVNACVQTVGLHYSGISEERDNSKYNFGHSAVSVREFLDSNGITYSVATSPCDQG